ncbi:MAG: DUF1015 family protein [Lachnospiraceae bacterium]|nr:DUF1015 family protein [Lachnospiraceae bacterium]
MAVIKAFPGIRPRRALAEKIAALPYDVYSRQEAKAEVEKQPLSFLRIDRAETQFPDDMDMYSTMVYQKARETLEEMIADGSFIQDETPSFYLYDLTMDGRTQTGLVGCASIDDYLNDIIKKHEKTRDDKELDRIRHVDVCNAQTGPIFLAYRRRENLTRLFQKIKQKKSVYDFTCEDGIRHQVWVIADRDQIEEITETFVAIDRIYIADGHHRTASAVKVGLKRRKENPGYTGKEAFNYFLSVFFAEDELRIWPYNRVVKDLYGHTPEAFLGLLQERFIVSDGEAVYVKPKSKKEVSMYLDGLWYRVKAKEGVISDDPVAGLAVSILQDNILAPLLGIVDIKTDTRIHFVGGIRGVLPLIDAIDKNGGAAFAMYPTTIEELFEVSDANLLMPPKSTWFEPKLRSGLFIHRI